MGSSQSTMTTKQKLSTELNESQLRQIYNSCSSIQTGSQLFKLEDVHDAIIKDVRIENIMKNSCVIESAIKTLSETGMDQDMLNDLSQSLRADGVFSSDSVSTAISQDVSMSVDKQSRDELISESTSIQDVKQEFVIKDSSKLTIKDVTLANKAFNESLQSSLIEAVSNTKVSLTAGNYTANTSDVSRKMFDLGSEAMITVIIILIIIILLGGGGIYVYSKF